MQTFAAPSPIRVVGGQWKCNNNILKYIRSFIPVDFKLLLAMLLYLSIHPLSRASSPLP